MSLNPIEFRALGFTNHDRSRISHWRLNPFEFRAFGFTRIRRQAAWRASLNPFEFRAFGFTDGAARNARGPAVLIPLNSGHSDSHVEFTPDAAIEGLNPFEFRAFGFTGDDGMVQRQFCLNPFEFRAFGFTGIVPGPRVPASVLIPLNSGHSDSPVAELVAWCKTCLNPFEFRAFGFTWAAEAEFSLSES